MVLGSAAFHLDIGYINSYTLHGKNMIQSLSFLYGSLKASSTYSDNCHGGTKPAMEELKVTLSEILATRVDMSHPRII